MNFIACSSFGPPEVLQLARQPVPALSEGEVLIKVAAAGVNRADLLQRKGKYPPPTGVSTILGMEVSGTVVALKGASRWKLGDRVCALLGGGGYAEYVNVPSTHCLPLPTNLTMLEGAALVEAAATVFANIFEDGRLKLNETALIHGGSSGIGTMAIQMIKALGGSVFATVGSEDKAVACRGLGADLVILYKEKDFVAEVLKATHGHGVNVVLDMVGGEYVGRNLQTLASHGRHVSIATQSGSTAEINIRELMLKNLILTGSTLRGRDLAEKTRLLGELEHKIWPLIAQGTIKPVIYQTFPLKNAARAHKVMESGAHIGKMVLEVSEVG